MNNAHRFSLLKMSGAGNTFSLIDARPGSEWSRIEKEKSLVRAEVVKRICHPIFGVSTDGALFIEQGPGGFDFSWDFYNKDGSRAEMCGNAARCAAIFCGELKMDFLKTDIRFKTMAGLVTARVLENSNVQVAMPPAQVLNTSLHLKSHSSAIETFVLVNTGVPHLVQKIHTMADLSALKEMASEMRSHLDLAPAGANVTFYVEKTLGKIEAATYERGIEDYTMACGTGAVAAAKAHQLESGCQSVDVKMPGGMLRIEFSLPENSPLMTGEAVIVGEFKYNVEALK